MRISEGLYSLVARIRLPAVIAVVLLMGALFAWSALGVLNARNSLRGLQATVGVSSSDLNTVSRIDVVAAQLSEARETLTSLRWWTAPLRSTAVAWSWMPWWGGDIGELNPILDYAETVLETADAVVTAAYSASYLEPGWTVTNLRRTESALTWHEYSLSAAANTLRVAKGLRGQIDDERLSETMRQKLQVVDGLRGELGASIEVALAAPTILDSQLEQYSGQHHQHEYSPAPLPARHTLHSYLPNHAGDTPDSWSVLQASLD